MNDPPVVLASLIPKPSLLLRTNFTYDFCLLFSGGSKVIHESIALKEGGLGDKTIVVQHLILKCGVTLYKHPPTAYSRFNLPQDVEHPRTNS